MSIPDLPALMNAVVAAVLQHDTAGAVELLQHTNPEDQLEACVGALTAMAAAMRDTFAPPLINRMIIDRQDMAARLQGD